jgi:predicted PurR-regulated permease PerM
MINLSDLVRANKKVASWVTFFALLFLVRKVFGLVFLTFILDYIFNNAVIKLENYFRLKRYFWTVVIYLLIVSVITSLMAMPPIIIYFLLATLFSFDRLDLPNLKSRILALRQTRDVYDETADSVAQFALVVG